MIYKLYNTFFPQEQGFWILPHTHTHTVIYGPIPLIINVENSCAA